MLSVSEGALRQFVCCYCWQLEWIASGVVDDGEELYAAYHASWAPGEPLYLAVSVGPWQPDDRRRVMTFRVRRRGFDLHVVPIDGRGRHFFPELLGRPLSRLGSLLWPGRRRAWRAALKVITADSRVRAALHSLGDSYARPLPLATR